MPKFFINENQIKENQIYIKGQDVKHIEKVLRNKIGDEIEICNKDNSQNYLCTIKKINEDSIECEIKDKIDTQAEPKIKVTIFQGLPKSEKMELVIQKSVELGAHDIVPVEMERCVVKLNSKDKIKKIERWQKISEVAAKQCKRNIVPKIHNVKTIKEICNLANNYDILLVAYENEKENTLKKEIKNLLKQEKQELKIGVLIGPEGGISTNEIEILRKNNAKIITLGSRILRTETVALNILSILMYEF